MNTYFCIKIRHRKLHLMDEFWSCSTYIFVKPMTGWMIMTKNRGGGGGGGYLI